MHCKSVQFSSNKALEPQIAGIYTATLELGTIVAI